MRITYERFLQLFPELSDEQKERARLAFKRIEEDEKNPPDAKTHTKRPFSFDWAGGLSELRDKYTSVELQKELLRHWSGI